MSARFLWWLPLLLLLGCGSGVVQKQPAHSLSGKLVDIEGNQEVPLRRLQEAIVKGDMSSAATMAKTVTGVYFDSGFVQAQVKTEEGPERITIRIAEGARFTFGRLQFKGKGRGSLPAPPFSEGDVYSSEKVRRYLESLRAFYARANHQVALRPLIETRPKTRSIDITVEIQGKDTEGPIHLAAAGCEATPNIGRGEPLVLRKNQEVILGPEKVYHFSRICVRDLASIRVCSQAKLRVPGRGTVVIGGRGIGGVSGAAEVVFSSVTRNKIYILFDNAAGHIRAVMYASLSASLVYSITGKGGLTLSGSTSKKREANLGWNDTRNFPSCN